MMFSLSYQASKYRGNLSGQKDYKNDKEITLPLPGFLIYEPTMTLL